MKVNETRKRSIAKSVVIVGMEICIDTIILTYLSFILPPIGLAVVVEVICLGNHYIMERIFNKLQWGRKIEHV